MKKVANGCTMQQLLFNFKQSNNTHIIYNYMDKLNLTIL